MGNLPNTEGDAAWLDALIERQPTVSIAAELETRILASFDDVTARREAGIGAAIARLGGRFRDAIWPGAPAWQPASVLALSLVVGVLAGNYLPMGDLISDQSEQTANIALDTPPAFDLSENS